MKANALKNYRCIFHFGHGKTTMSVVAADASTALSEAQLTVQGDPDTIEVWDETGLVLERNPSRRGARDPVQNILKP